MKLSGCTEHISNAIKRAASVAPVNDPRDIIKNVALVAEKDALQVVATDLEVGLRLFIKGESVDIKKPGAILINAKKASQIFNKLKDDKVKLSVLKSGQLQISTAKSKFRVNSENYDNFPLIGEVNKPYSLSIPADKFYNMAKKTVFASAKELSNFAMHGVLIEVSKGTMRLVATDSKRLALVEEKISNESVDDAIVAPRKGIETAIKVIEKSDEMVGVELGESYACFKTESAEVFVRLISGQFAPYRQVLPKLFKNNLTFNRAEMLNALEQSMLMVADNDKIARFNFTDSKLNIITKSQEFGTSSIELDADHKGELTIGLNPQYIIEALKAMQTDTLTWRFNKPLDSAVFEEADGLYYVAMPVRLH